MKIFTSIIRRQILAAIIFMSASTASTAAIKNDTIMAHKCLDVIGIAVGENNEVLNGAQVRLFKENEELEWIEITNVSYHDHNFTFALDPDSYYTIEVSKPGYVKRAIAISTMLPDNLNVKVPFAYGFEVVLFKASEGVDDFYFDFPVALISYDEKKNSFENNARYTRHIKGKIRESISKVNTTK